MTDTCSSHRPYLAAIADGEVSLVPEPTLDHVADCARCTAEVADHGLLGEKLRAGFELAVSRPRRTPRGVSRLRHRTAGLAVAATLLMGGLGVTAAWRITQGGSDPVADAVAAAHGGPVLRSSDPDAIGAWCARNSERQRPQVALPPLVPLGARMDAVGGTTIVTVFYSASGGHELAVGWLDATPSTVSESRIAARTVSGDTALVVQTPRGTAVLSGDVPSDALWTGAATLESLTG